MTTSIRFLVRTCPVCGASECVDGVHSAVRAETLGWDNLAKSWRGLFHDKSFFTYRRCVRCGLLYAPAYFDNDQLAALYAEMEENMAEVGGDVLRRTQNGYFKRVAPYCQQPGGYLELGPDVGYFAADCVATGMFDKLWLVEPNRAVWTALKQAVAGHGDLALLGDLFDLGPIPGDTVSFAAAIHVLDHVIDPVATLRQVRAKMVRGGHIMSVTHDERSTLAKFLGNRWPAYCLQHPQLYNPDTIRQLYSQSGFDVVFVEKSINYFPIFFLVRQALWATLKVKIPDIRSLARFDVGLPLGNIICVARAG